MKPLIDYSIFMRTCTAVYAYLVVKIDPCLLPIYLQTILQHSPLCTTNSGSRGGGMSALPHGVSSWVRRQKSLETGLAGT